MRRFKQQIPEDEAKKILKESTNGVLCLTDWEGKPYGVPMSFIYDEGNAIYFHCAISGRKIDIIKKNTNACFVTIAQDEIHPDEFTTYFKSVIVEGKIKILSNRQKMFDALRLLSTKYSPGIDCDPEIEKSIDRVTVLKLEIENITGKEAIELTKQRI